MTLTTALKRTQDRKTANLSNAAGKQSVIANAFSLPAGREFSCGGATSICERVCYAGKLERIYKGFRAVVLHNWNILKDAPIEVMNVFLTTMIAEFEAECDKRGARKLFRIHADGDFFSEDYARAWREVILASPDIQFWVYTRSFVEEINVIPIIAGLDNLSVYLSVDSDNARFVDSVVSEYPDVRIATLGETAADAADIMAQWRDKPGGKCPENVKQIPLIDTNGGACVNCGLCVFGKSDIRFAIKKR
jgi:hypothetical protein